jgi:hypothetical protein
MMSKRKTPYNSRWRYAGRRASIQVPFSNWAFVPG